MWFRAPVLPAAGRRKTGPPEWPQTSTHWIGSLVERFVQNDTLPVIMGEAGD
jgi:hypothetical protein